MTRVVKKNIKMKDVAKVMRDVGYNKTNVDSKSGSNIEDQLAQANENAKSVPTMADAINRAVEVVTPKVDVPIELPKGVVVGASLNPVKAEPKGSKGKDVEKKKEKPKVEPVEDLVDKEDDIREPKLVVIDMTTLLTEVTFTGEGWKILDIKLAYAAMVRAFRIKIRDEYRKGIV